ncbi:spidroin-1-like [Bactrocera tryoni]|uniref:spidroin-1-like n=1 Tax=Bactrocera tryoni TaxID=59916 RepID=UPI001A95D4AA|nr:spidroin-1-like [Bactrocera tryoni]
MRAFIVLCLFTVACADKLGYNYRPVGHSDAGLSFAPGGSSGFGGLGGGGLGDSGFGGLGGSSGGPGGLGSYGGPGGAATQVSPSYSAPAAEFDKEFYTYSADENDFNEPAGSEQLDALLKKNLRVVFVKGPENNGLENAALNLARLAAEKKTAIYVLQKQADLGDLANKLQSQHGLTGHKPDVHFVKYRTPEDAANAQRAIQSQYDQLGGNSQSHDGGAAPVHDFSSPASRPAARPVSAPGASYLPSSIIRK